MSRHPDFVGDVWAMDENLMGFLVNLPRFMNPDAHQARQRAIEAVRDWHSWARDNFTPESVDEAGNDPFWGTRFFRERQQIFSKMDGFCDDALASVDLSVVWRYVYCAVPSV